jgi:hypothetical protein
VVGGRCSDRWCWWAWYGRGMIVVVVVVEIGGERLGGSWR